MELGPCAVPANEKEWLALGQVRSAVSLCLQRCRVDMWQGVMGGTRACCTVFQVGTLCKVKLKAVTNTVKLCVENKNRSRCALEKTNISILIWLAKCWPDELLILCIHSYTM